MWIRSAFPVTVSFMQVNQSLIVNAVVNLANWLSKETIVFYIYYNIVCAMDGFEHLSVVFVVSNEHNLLDKVS